MAVKAFERMLLSTRCTGEGGKNCRCPGCCGERAAERARSRGYDLSEPVEGEMDVHTPPGRFTQAGETRFIYPPEDIDR